jgi:hypothetical protein
LVRMSWMPRALYDCRLPQGGSTEQKLAIIHQ